VWFLGTIPCNECTEDGAEPVGRSRRNKKLRKTANITTLQTQYIKFDHYSSEQEPVDMMETALTIFISLLPYATNSSSFSLAPAIFCLLSSETATGHFASSSNRDSTCFSARIFASSSRKYKSKALAGLYLSCVQQKPQQGVENKRIHSPDQMPRRIAKRKIKFLSPRRYTLSWSWEE
jgi:hypothetical protein